MINGVYILIHIIQILSNVIKRRNTFLTKSRDLMCYVVQVAAAFQPGALENRYLVFIQPNNGNGHVVNTLAGMIGIDGGLNTAGITMMTQI